MNVALIVQRFPYGGAESYVKQIAQRLHAIGNDVTVISSQNKDSDDKIYPFPILRLTKLFSIGEYSFWRGLGSYLKKGNFDLVHVNTYGYFHSDYAASQKKKYQYKLILTSHGFTGLDIHQLKKNKIIQKNSLLDVIRPIYDAKIGKKTIQSCDHLIALSKHDVEFYTQMGIDNSKITIIPPGISESFFIEPDVANIKKIRSELDADPILLSVSELSWIKSHAVMIRAMPLIIKEKPRAKLFLIGKDRTELQNLKQLSRKFDVEKHVSFLGFKNPDKVKAFMDSADLLLHTSLAEGLSTSLLEAMACGLPFITTPAGGNGYLAQESGAGMTIPFENEGALASTVIELVNDKKKWLKLSASGKAHSKEISWDKIFDRIKSVYSNLLNHDRK